MRLVSIEEQIVKATIDALLAKNYQLAVYDGEETVLGRSTDVERILAAMQTTDEDYLLVHTPGSGFKQEAWVRFIYRDGDEGLTVIRDYTPNLGPVMAIITALIDEYKAR